MRSNSGNSLTNSGCAKKVCPICYSMQTDEDEETIRSTYICPWELIYLFFCLQNNFRQTTSYSHPFSCYFTTEGDQPFKPRIFFEWEHMQESSLFTRQTMVSTPDFPNQTKNHWFTNCSAPLTRPGTAVASHVESRDCGIGRTPARGRAQEFDAQSGEVGDTPGGWEVW